MAFLSGDSAAAVKIIDFSDLQCPFCRRFHSAVADARTKHGSQVARVFVHFPLSNHQLAMPAAVAAECAAASGRFAAFIDLTYEKQDSLGVKSWTSMAAAAGVQDTAAFAKCVANTRSFPRIERGLKLGSVLGVRGTPTVIVNGWRLAKPPYNELPTLIETILSGKPPFPK